jgi:hypothetical protein
MNTVWVFTGERANFPSGVFTSRTAAERWIGEHGLSGTLTAYPLDTGIYEWAASNGYFRPSRDEHRTAEFIGRFSSASLEHYHYENGAPT